jgi:hypothetical protein
MTSGRQTLASLDTQIQQLRLQVQEHEAALQATGRRLVDLGQERAGQHRRLAELRLAELERNTLVQGLDAAERRVREILGERAAALEELRQASAESERAQTRIEGERQAQAEQFAEATEGLDRLQAATQARLAADPAYRAQLERASQASSVARQAEEKTRQAEADRAEKGRPYEADPLFLYLWRRGYGTSTYRAGPLVRLLDGWVARRVRYADARANYTMLLEIPQRLREHAERQGALAAAGRETLETMERTALEADGLPDRQEALEAARARLTELDRALAGEEERFREVASRQAAFAAGQDEFTRRGIEVLAQELGSQGVEALRRKALASPSAEDDLVVSALARGQEEERGLEAVLADQRAVYDGTLRRLRELEEVRRRFKQQSYDAATSEFRDDSMLPALFAEFMRGLLSSDQLWRALERGQRFRRPRADPGFGSGGLGDLWRGGGGGGFGRRGGGGFGGGGGGGGFRTGGGF